MALLIGFEPGALDPKVAAALDDIIAPIQTWAGVVEGVNAAGISTAVKTGSAFMWFTDTAPDGYLLLDGTAVSRGTYSALFSLFGVAYGIGDGSTTFNLPDLRQRFPMGKAAAGTGNALGATGGLIDHVHTGPSHTHTGPSHTHTGPSHTHGAGSFTTGTHNHGGTTGVGSNENEEGGFFGSGSYLFNVQDTAHTHTISTQAAMAVSGTSGADGTGATGADGTGATGAGGTGNTGTANPPFVVVNFIVKT